MVFLRTTCHYCESSAPFYNRLHRLSLASDYKWKLFIVFSEPQEQVQAFLTRVHLGADPLPIANFDSFGVHATPTALLVDDAGVITRAWIGTSETVQSDILAALGLQGGQAH